MLSLKVLFGHSMRRHSIAAALAFQLVLSVQTAHAVPSFAVQVGQPCAACHVGAFGPQLTSYGRDFKLNAYTASDTKDHFPPLAIVGNFNFTRTKADQNPAPEHYGSNDNFTVGEVSMYFAGRLNAHFGTFIEGSYDGAERSLHLGNVDLRYAHDGTWWGTDVVYGVSINNGPTTQDLWNSTPSWGFPYNSSALAPTPATSALIDGTLNTTVLGAGGYVMIDDTVFLELAAYRGLGTHELSLLGNLADGPVNSINGLAPYWRVAYQKEFDKGHQNLEFGAYGMQASVVPQSVRRFGSNKITDIAFDANYQYMFDPRSVAADMISAHATYIHEHADIGASFGAGGADNRTATLNTFRADVSYASGASWIPTLQYFRTTGSTDLSYRGTETGKPNSEGYVAELAYVPFGKPNSPFSNLNARVVLQYVGYSRFDGLRRGASDNNTIWVNLALGAGWPPK